MYSDEQPTCDLCGHYNFNCKCRNCLNCKHWDGKEYLGKCRNIESGNYGIDLLFYQTCLKFEKGK